MEPRALQCICDCAALISCYSGNENRSIGLHDVFLSMISLSWLSRGLLSNRSIFYLIDPRATGTARQRLVSHRQRSPPTVRPPRGPAAARSGPSKRGKREGLRSPAPAPL